MPDRKFATIVASPRARTGKTFLARLIAEHHILAGDEPVIFDTDAAERQLAACFPNSASVIDLDRVPDQMKLFDTLTAERTVTQVIDLTHRSFKKFFRLVRDIDFVSEAKSRGIEPVIFFIPDREPDTYEQALTTRNSFRDCSFVLVEQAFLGEPSRETRRSSAFETLAPHRPRLALPQLDPFLAGAIDDPALSLSEFMRLAQSGQSPAPGSPRKMSLAYLSREARSGITAWLGSALADIKRVLQEVDVQTDILTRDPIDS